MDTRHREQLIALTQQVGKLLAQKGESFRLEQAELLDAYQAVLEGLERDDATAVVEEKI